MQHNEPWWVLADVCKVLEITNDRNAAARLDADEKNTVHIMDGNRGNPNMTIINESGLYSLILASRKPSG
ncbi:MULTISPECIES: Bro-N domain-containing protein [Acetobacter]|uniref:BRO-N domain-containing protein n=1 Tax=Acetobacter TaxID=434 RepID=UPI0007772DA2|nr:MULTISPECIES: Bro-N domain-containing protein [Acetobacter]